MVGTQNATQSSATGMPGGAAAGEDTSGPVVHLLGGFAVTSCGLAVDLPSSTHRLLAFLALRGRPVERRHVASCLWLDKSEDRAHANLRSALWRLRRCEVPLVMAAATHLALRREVTVDTDALLAAARALVTESDPVDLSTVDERALGAELLPMWYDDFVELERERFRQMRLHALEAFSRRLVRAGSYARAVDAGLTAVNGDPLRESAHRVVIEAHLAEGNRAEAVVQFRRLAQVLDQQLGIRPTRGTCDLIAVRQEGGGSASGVSKQRSGREDMLQGSPALT